MRTLKPSEFQSPMQKLRLDVTTLLKAGLTRKQIIEELGKSNPSQPEGELEDKIKLFTRALLKLTYSRNINSEPELVYVNGTQFLKFTSGQIVFFADPVTNAFLFADELPEPESSKESAVTKMPRLDIFDKGLTIEKIAAYDSLIAHYSKYVHFDDPAIYGFLAAYTIMSYCYEPFMNIPYAKLSGEKGSGKTTMMNVMADLVHKGILLSSTTPAALYRIIDEEKPTLFLDESEKLEKRTGSNDDLMLILNSGYQKDGMVARTKVSKKEDSDDKSSSSSVTRYSTFCPKVIAAINDLAPATMDRCIVINFKTAPLEAKITKYNSEDPEVKREISLLREKILLTSAKMSRELVEYSRHPEKLNLDFELNNRSLDKWHPLLAIATLSASRSKFEDLEMLCMLDIESKALAERKSAIIMARSIICEFVIPDKAKFERSDANTLMVQADQIFRVIKENDDYNRYSGRGQLTKVLKQLGITTARRRRDDGKLKTYYLIPESLLSTVTEYLKAS